ncbi:MAG: hypothetical protein JFR24_08230 [Muribaculaceae bacterium]|jgi:hypothetical protein|nr:hypothetical protein [Muribaculaceae bacterium]MCI9118022.1 hypothetical protein [Muribaculaceae bacterium]
MKISPHTALKAAATVTALPLLVWPLCAARAGAQALVWLYPVAITAYAALAVACGRERPALAWILLAMSTLTSLAIWML